MKEQNKYDQMPLSLMDRLKHVSPLADKVADEIVSEDTEILVVLMPRMFKVMQEIAKFLCEYIKRERFSRQSLFWIPQTLMIVERAGDALIHSHDKEMMEKLGEDLENVIKDFLYAVDVEALCLVKEIGKYTLSQFRVSAFLVALCRARAPTQAS